MYRVIKVLNNNGILALDSESRKETILLGRGVGFGRRTGERVEVPGDVKKYELVPHRYSALQQINSIDTVFIETAAEIIDRAEPIVGELRHDILIPMADHIALAVKRAREQAQLPNPFKYDIKALFEREFQAALTGRQVILDKMGVEISDDEVGYITLHIHAGLSEENVADALMMAQLVQDSIRMIEDGIGMELRTDSLGYNRLVSHLRYMIARTRNGEKNNLDLEAYAKQNFPEMYAVAEQTCRVMEKKLGLSISQEEVGFLAIHIKRVSIPD